MCYVDRSFLPVPVAGSGTPYDNVLRNSGNIQLPVYAMTETAPKQENLCTWGKVAASCCMVAGAFTVTILASECRQQERVVAMEGSTEAAISFGVSTV